MPAAAVVILVAVLAASCSRDAITPGTSASGAAATTPAVDAAAALRTVAPDLDRRLAQFKAVQMPFTPSGLSPTERQMIDELVVACQRLESIYWRQSDPEGMALYRALDPN